MSSIFDQLTGKIAKYKNSLDELMSANGVMDQFLDDHEVGVMLYSQTQGYEVVFDKINEGAQLSIRLSNRNDVKYSAEVTQDLIRVLTDIVLLKFVVAFSIDKKEALGVCTGISVLSEITSKNTDIVDPEIKEAINLIGHLSKKYPY